MLQNVEDGSAHIMHLTTAEIRARLLQKYQNSKLIARVRAQIKESTVTVSINFQTS